MDRQLRFGYCAAENDVYQYQGAEFLFIGIDELTLFTLRQWQFLTSRNRCPIAKTFPNMAGATNPGNIGHAWVKSLWIDKQPAAGMENPECYDPADYDFISARVHDNPIYAADQNYLKTLAALPSHLRRAFLDGDWEVFAGQYFDNFDVTRHIARAETVDWKPWWPRWISIDWGFEHPSATYWHAAAPAVNAVSSVGARPSAHIKDVPERATSTPAPSTHNRATSGSESHADAQTNGSTSPSSFAGHGSAVPLRTDSNAASDRNAQNVATGGTGPSVLRVNRNACATQTVITYREYVTHRTSPRDLAHEIIARSLARDDADGLRTAGVPPVPLPLGVSSPYAHNQNSKTPAGGQRYENPSIAIRIASHSTTRLTVAAKALLTVRRPPRSHGPPDLASRTTSQSAPHTKKSTPSTSPPTPSPAAPTKPPSPTRWATSSPPPASRAPSPPTTIASAAGC